MAKRYKFMPKYTEKVQLLSRGRRIKYKARIHLLRRKFQGLRLFNISGKAKKNYKLLKDKSALSKASLFSNGANRENENMNNITEAANDTTVKGRDIIVDIGSADNLPNDPCSSQSLKKFKKCEIPKLNPSGDKQIDVNPSNILVNDAIETGSLTQQRDPKLVNKVLMQTNNFDVEELFGIKCINYIRGLCPSNRPCNQSHILNDPILENLSIQQVNIAYRFICTNVLLYRRYFSQFCHYYASQHMYRKLLNMVYDCERYPKYAEQLMDVYKALVDAGLPEICVCTLMWDRLRHNNSPIIRSRLAIMIFKAINAFNHNVLTK